MKPWLEEHACYETVYFFVKMATLVVQLTAVILFMGMLMRMAMPAVPSFLMNGFHASRAYRPVGMGFPQTGHDQTGHDQHKQDQVTEAVAKPV